MFLFHCKFALTFVLLLHFIPVVVYGFVLTSRQVNALYSLTLPIVLYALSLNSNVLPALRPVTLKLVSALLVNVFIVTHFEPSYLSST